MRHLILLAVLILCCGCGGGGGVLTASGSGITAGVNAPGTPGGGTTSTETITVRAVTSVLPRDLPSETRYVRGTGFESDRVVYQETVPYSAQTEFVGVPLSIDEFRLEFVVSQRVFGVYEESISAGQLQGGVYTITDPEWADVPLLASVIENLAVARIRSLSVVDANTLWLAGNGGTLLKSTDGGQSFEFQIVGTENNLEDIDFLDSLKGWAVAGDDQLYFTTDGGASWGAKAVVATGFSDDQSLRTVVYLRNGAGAVGGGRGQFDPSVVYGTQDSGDSWTRDTLSNISRFPLLDLAGTSPVAWGIVEGDILYRSNDNGLSWTELPTRDLQGFGIDSIDFESNNTRGYALSPNAIFYTDDGAANFQQGNTPISQGLQRVAVVDTDVAVAVGNGAILRTTDGGANWTLASGDIPDERFVDVEFADSSVGFAVTISGILLRSEDGGATWVVTYDPTRDISVDLTDVRVVDANFAAAVGAGGLFLKTEDAGQSFSISEVGDGKTMFAVDFVTSALGFAAGRDGEIWRTIDGGDAWELVSIGLTYDHATLRDISAPDGRHVFAVGEPSDTGLPGTVVKSTDGGRSWNTSHNGLLSSSLFGVSFVTSQSGIVVGENGQIATTTDGGANWVQRSSGTTATLNGVFFHQNGNFAVAVGDGGAVLTSNDAGANWTSRASGTGHDLQSVCFSTELSGVTVGVDGTVLETEDGGLTWTPMPLPIPHNLASCSLYLDGSGLVVGENGSLVTLRSGAENIPAFAGPPAPSVASLSLSSGPTDGEILTVLPSITVEVIGDSTSVREVSVRLETVTSTGDATLSGTLIKETFQGQATFDDLIVDTRGTYRLVFESSGLTSVSSGNFTLENTEFGRLVGINGETLINARAYTYNDVSVAKASDPPDTIFASSDFNVVGAVEAGARKNILFAGDPVNHKVSLFHLDANTTTDAFDEITINAPWDLAYDSERDRLFVVQPNSIHIRDNASEGGNGSVDENRSITGYSGLSCCHYVPEDDRLFVAGAGTIYVIDNASTASGSMYGVTQRVLSGTTPYYEMAYDRQTDSLYFTDVVSGDIGVIENASTASGSAIIARTITVGSSAPRAILDPVREIMYVGRWLDGEIDVFEGYRSLSGTPTPDRVINQSMADGVLIRMPY